jgi:hypothetical protein
VTASSAVTIPRASCALIIRKASILRSLLRAAVSLDEVRERADHHQDEIE